MRKITDIPDDAELTEEERQHKEVIERNRYYTNMCYEDKVDVAKTRIIEWADTCAENGKICAVSVGGLDSITLLILARDILGPDLQGYSVSSLEDRSIQAVHKQLGVVRVASHMNMRQVLQDFGFPVYSKEIAAKIRHLQVPREERDGKIGDSVHLAMTGWTGEKGGYRYNRLGKLNDKILELFGGEYPEERPDLICQKAPFKVSDKCCLYMKEAPLVQYQKEHDIWPFLGLMQSEGGRRKWSLRNNGCNYVSKTVARSCPFNYFSRQDLLRLALDLNVPVPEIYGKIVSEDGKLKTTGFRRTGCVMCGFGIGLAKGSKRPHNFDRLRERDPKQWEYWMYRCCEDESGERYGWGRVLDYIGVEWEDELITDTNEQMTMEI